MVKVMKSFKNVTFIWKYESEETSFANGAENIIFKKWTPQTALLGKSINVEYDQSGTDGKLFFCVKLTVYQISKKLWKIFYFQSKRISKTLSYMNILGIVKT